MLSADAFGAFEEVLNDHTTDSAAGAGLPEPLTAIGKRFRETVLALGGSVEPMQVFVDFRGRRPTTEALLRHSGLSAA